jgi:hypothetical protein
MKKKTKTQINEIIDMVEEGLVREAGAKLHNLGYRDLGETLMTVDPILAYMSVNKEKVILGKIVNSLQKLKMMTAKKEEKKKKEPSPVFSDIKKAMDYIKTKPEEKLKKEEIEDKGDAEERKKLQPLQSFQYLSVSDRIGMTQGDVAVVGSISSVVDALRETDYLVDRLSSTEGVIRNAPIVGVRQDTLYMPTGAKPVKKKKKGSDSDWREGVHKKKDRMILKDQVYAIVARTYPELIIVVDHTILSEGHYYFLLLPKLITQEPFTKFRFGRARSPIKDWSILGVE